mmetsp:Transcript_30282/g.87276  ORF Transcript_30282/g.87276 Transcript_30282/m.87276 type:complete len:166 (-) Transcript_30282:4702-5199(-)
MKLSINGRFQMFFDSCRVMASSGDSSKKSFERVKPIRMGRSKSEDPIYFAKDQSFDDARRVAAMWREVSVEILRFLEDSCLDPIGLRIKAKSQVKKVRGVTTGAECPAEFPKRVPTSLESVPTTFVLEGIWVAEPDTETIIQVAFVKKKVFRKARQGLLFMDSEI